MVKKLLQVALLGWALQASAQTTYYMQGLLRQPDAATARAYLGIGGGGSGSVTNFAMTDFSPLFTTTVTTPTTWPHVSLSPISQSAHLFFAAPVGGSGTPTFRAIDASDLPGGGGSVTSFSSGNLSPLFTTSVANPTTTPALSYTLNSQSANLVFAGPTSGGAAAPTFRSLVAGDIPDLGTIYLRSITNAGEGLGLTLISTSNGPIAGLKSISAGTGVSVQDNGGTNISISAPGNVAGVDIPMTFTSPYSGNTNFNIDFTFAAQTLNTPTNLIVFNYATNWGLNSTGRVADIFIQWTNFGRLVYFVNQATNWQVSPKIWYVPPGYGARLHASAYGQLDTNIMVTAFIDSFPVGSNTTASFNPTNVFPSATKLWLDASRLVWQDEAALTPAQDGSVARAWTDLSKFTTMVSNNASLAMVNKYSGPQSAPYNVPSMAYFPGVGWMQSPAFSSLGPPMWGFIVFYGRNMGNVVDAIGTRFALQPGESGQTMSFFSGSGLQANGQANVSWVLFSFFSNSPNSIIRTNGVQAVTGITGNPAATSWIIGSDNSKTSAQGTANVAEILILQTNLTAAQLTNVESYFYRKYPFFTPPTVQ